MNRTAAALLSASLLVTASCHATQLAVTWHQPGAQPINFHKNVAVFVSKDEATEAESPSLS